MSETSCNQPSLVSVNSPICYKLNFEQSFATNGCFALWKWNIRACLVALKGSKLLSHSKSPFKEFDSLVVEFWFNNIGNLANEVSKRRGQFDIGHHLLNGVSNAADIVFEVGWGTWLPRGSATGVGFMAGSSEFVTGRFCSLTGVGSSTIWGIHVGDCSSRRICIGMDGGNVTV